MSKMVRSLLTYAPLLAIALLATFLLAGVVNTPKASAICGGTQNFFFIHSWTYFFPKCDKGVPQIEKLTDFTAIAAWAVDTLIKVSGFVAFAFVVWGGMKYIIAQGEANAIAEAKNTVVQAIAGMIICIAASAIINFVAQTFK